MKQNVGKLNLYRLYDFNKENNTALFYILDGDIESKIFTQPMQFKVYKKFTEANISM